MTRQIIPIMPTPLMVEESLLSDEDYATLLENISEVLEKTEGKYHMFQCDVESTYREYNIGKDEKFKKINYAVLEAVNDMAKQLGAVREIALFDGWLNRYVKGQHQELHHHGNFHFSAVYFAEFAEGSSPLMFENKNYPLNEPLFDSNYQTGWQRMTALEAKPNTLVIFPSNIFHMVPPSRNESGYRTTIAWNFREVEERV